MRLPALFFSLVIALHLTAAPAKIHHVVVVVLENEDLKSAERAPFLSRLGKEGALLRNYRGLVHPSHPNYIAMTAGSMFGVKTDAIATLNVAHLGDLLEKKQLTWRVYAEDYPGGCYLRSEGSKGLYARRHVPFIEYADVQNDFARCRHVIRDGKQLDADLAEHGHLPAFSYYVPNQKNNGHDTSLGTADRFLQKRFGPLLQDERFTKDTLFIITFDESDSRQDMRIATVLWGAGVKRGSVSNRPYDHYSLLRTIEDIFDLGTLGKEDAKAHPIDDVLTWR